MDEPSQSDEVPRQWRQRDSALMKTAALVLPASPSLCEARRALHPASLGMKSIGHMGYFRPAAQPLWDEVLGWLRSGTASQPFRSC